MVAPYTDDARSGIRERAGVSPVCPCADRLTAEHTAQSAQYSLHRPAPRRRTGEVATGAKTKS